MDPLIYIILITLIPAIELRGSIPVGIGLGMDPLLVFIICVAVNFAIAPVGFLALDFLDPHFSKIGFYRRFVAKLRKRKLGKGAKSFVALAAFVAVPLPATGAYTGTLLAWLLGMERKKSCIAINAGVLIGAILITAIMLGALEIIRWML